jgi:hypothetical protein
MFASERKEKSANANENRTEMTALFFWERVLKKEIPLLTDAERGIFLWST